MHRWFNYEGIDAQGREVRGSLDAPTSNDADGELRRRGIQPVRIFEHDRVRVIEQSLACFTMGWLSLVPLLGVIAAVRGFILCRRTREEAVQEWNPARNYLRAGFALSVVGCLVTAVVGFAVLLAAIKSFVSGE